MKSAIPKIMSEKSEEQRGETVASNNHTDNHFTIQLATYTTYILKRQSCDKILMTKGYQNIPPMQMYFSPHSVGPTYTEINYLHFPFSFPFHKLSIAPF